MDDDDLSHTKRPRNVESSCGPRYSTALGTSKACRIAFAVDGYASFGHPADCGSSRSVGMNYIVSCRIIPMGPVLYAACTSLESLACRRIRLADYIVTAAISALAPSILGVPNPEKSPRCDSRYRAITSSDPRQNRRARLYRLDSDERRCLSPGHLPHIGEALRNLSPRMATAVDERLVAIVSRFRGKPSPGHRVRSSTAAAATRGRSLGTSTPGASGS